MFGVSIHESFDLYESGEMAGDRFLRRRAKWWEDHRIVAQMGVLLFDMAVLLGLIATAMLFPHRSLTAMMVVLLVGLVALAWVGSIPWLYEVVRSDYHARVRVGCRELGGVSVMPGAMLHRPGPLRIAAQRFVRDAGLDEREQECLSVLGEDWSSTLGELVDAARSLSRFEVSQPGNER
jgi:hypothetical protein